MLQMILMLIGSMLLVEVIKHVRENVCVEWMKNGFSRRMVTLTLLSGVSPVKLLTFGALPPPKPWMAVALAAELQRTGREHHKQGQTASVRVRRE